MLFPSDPDKISEKDLRHLHPFSTYNSTTGRNREVCGIVATNSDGVIGKQGDLPWRVPEDLKYFKLLTMGHTVIMGRKTWDSLPKRPLPGRRNMVITHQRELELDGAEVFGSVEEAIDACRDIPFIIGGEQIYRASFPLITRLFITEISADVADADAFFPSIDESEWRTVTESDSMLSSNGIAYRFVEKVRK